MSEASLYPIIDFDPVILLLLAIPMGWGSGIFCFFRSNHEFNADCLRLFSKIDYELEKLLAGNARP